MKKIVEILNVVSETSKLKGTLYLIGSQDVEATKLDTVKHVGLSVFFRPDEAIKAEYVKSFVLTVEEQRLLRRRRYRANVVRDIGYLLSISPSVLDIICLSGCSTPKPHSPLFKEERIDRATFSIEYNGRGLDKMEAEIKEKSMCGFELAVATSLGEMLNITDDTIVPAIFPGEGEVKTLDYINYCE